MEFFVGTYSRSIAGIDANGKGIYSVSFDNKTGAFDNPQLIMECVNPSAITLSKKTKILFAVKEVFNDASPTLSSFHIDDKNTLSFISAIEIEGELPCHLCYDNIHNRLASAQYWTGDVVISEVKDGILATPSVILPKQGVGPNPQRQEGPHAHCVAFSDGGEVLHVVDLGTDTVSSHHLNQHNQIIETSVLQLPEGIGPRHIVITKDSKKSYVLCELDESLIALSSQSIGWQIGSVCEGFKNPNDTDGSGAAIRLSSDEKHLYISSRTYSTIACFSVEKTPKRLGMIPTSGTTPRDFIISSDGNWLIVANQDTNNLASIKIDPTNGTLTETGHSCSIGSPVSIVENTI